MIWKYLAKKQITQGNGYVIKCSPATINTYIIFLNDSSVLLLSILYNAHHIAGDRSHAFPFIQSYSGI